MLRLGATPVRSRSSGTCATPARIAARGSPPRSGLPPTLTTPALAGRMPVSTSASSRWPFPATPATPSTSPARTASETSCRASTPRSPFAQSPSASRTTSPAWLGTRRRSVSTSWPTIRDASSSRVTSAVRSVATERPPRRTVTRSATSITSWSLWVMTITACPSAAITRSVRNRLCASCGVSTAVGSSRIRTREPLRTRLHDLDPLLLADRELPDLRIGVDGHVERLGRQLHLPRGVTRAEHESPAADRERRGSRPP